MNGFWWKIGGALIFLYVLIGGLVIPIKPGITSVTPSNAKSGEDITFNVVGYNTHFLAATKVRAWLKLDSIHAISATEIQKITENEAKFTFSIPANFPVKEAVQPLSLIVDNDVDGVFVQPNAIFATVADSSTISGEAWKSSGIGQFSVVEGIKFPYRNILNETIRNTFFHIALWFAMFILLIVGVYHAVRFLNTGDMIHDIKSASFNKIGIMYGVFGLITGSVWAKFTWDTFWTSDVKLNMTAIAMLIYLAYLVLRGSSSDHDRRAKLSASYSIFAFVALIPLVFIIPRMTDSLHPGNGGNPALGGEDLDNTLRLFFYPSIIALALLGTWMSQLLIRYEKLKEKVLLKNQ